MVLVHYGSVFFCFFTQFCFQNATSRKAANKREHYRSNIKSRGQVDIRLVSNYEVNRVFSLEKKKFLVLCPSILWVEYKRVWKVAYQMAERITLKFQNHDKTRNGR
nr:unnamed protein product [Callosobruchus analis]